jgi:hypothetical protein
MDIFLLLARCGAGMLALPLPGAAATNRAPRG